MRKICDLVFLILLTGLLSGCRSDMIQEENIFIEVTQSAAQSAASFDGYTVEVKSSMAESSSLYVTFGLAAPEEVDLSPLLDISRKETLSFGNLLAIPSATNFPANVYHQTADDGDGRDNTVNVIVQIAPVIPDGSGPAFGPGNTCAISFDAIQKRIESLPHTILATGEWQFTLGMDAAEQEAMELLSSPVTVPAEVIRLGEDEYALPPIAQEAVTVTSILLGPMDMQIAFEKPEPSQTFDCLFLEQDVYLMMADGRKVGFFQYESAAETATLSSDQPIILADARYLQFSDGTQVKIPG